MNAYTHADGSFSLNCPDEWEYEAGKASVVFFEPDAGVGAINISSKEVAAEFDARGALLEFLPASLHGMLHTSQVASALPNAYAEFERDDAAWRIWAFRGAERVAIVSYNCKKMHRGIEDNVVDAVVSSLFVS